MAVGQSTERTLWKRKKKKRKRERERERELLAAKPDANSWWKWGPASGAGHESRRVVVHSADMRHSAD